MDEIQKVLIKEGRKDLAQKYYMKVAGADAGRLSDIIQAFNTRVDDLIDGAYGKNGGGDPPHPQAAKIKAVANAIKREIKKLKALKDDTDMWFRDAL